MKKKTKTVKKPQDHSQKNSVGLTPLGDRVLIREIKESSGRTESGIYIPEGAKKDTGSKRGKVIAVGKGHYDDGALVPMTVKAGDTVLFQWGDQVVIDDEEYYLVREGEISAIVS